MKHSYICYAAISESKHFRSKDVGIFEFDWSVDEQNQPERYYKEWYFNPEIITEIEGLDEMQYKDFPFPDQEEALFLFINKNYPDLWKLAEKSISDLPRGSKMEITFSYTKDSEGRNLFEDELVVRVTNQEKRLTAKTFEVL